MKSIIKAENVGKRYRLGETRKPYSTVRESLVETLKAPFRSLRSAPEESSFWALEDVSFEIQPGEVVGIIGRNGAGKSTLLKVLSRITEPTKGRIELFGRVASLLEVGTGFHGELTGRENIFLNGAILGMKRAEIARKFDEIVDFAEVDKFIDTPVKHYSSGMYVRLAFAVAASLEPEILIVDEVLAVGDAQFQKKCLSKMQDVSEKGGRTVLFVSHNLTSIETLCSKALLLKNGKSVQFGDTKDVVNTYLSKELKSEAERVWEKPAEGVSGGFIHPKRVAVVPRWNEGESVITVETPIDIEFEFWNSHETELALSLGVTLWNIAGECIFSTVSKEVKESAGLFRGVLKIPANLLNDNTYTLEMCVLEETSLAHFRMTDVVTFEVNDVPRVIKYFGKWMGAVRPGFDFELEKV